MKDIIEKYKAGALFKNEFLAAGYLFERGDYWKNITCGPACSVARPEFVNESHDNDMYVLVDKSAALDRLIAHQSKRTLHDVIALTKGQWQDNSQPIAVPHLAVDFTGISFVSDKGLGNAICTEREHDDYVKQIERDYKQYKEDYMRHHQKPFTGELPPLLFTSINGDTMQPEFSSNPFAGNFAKAMQDSKAQCVIDDAEEFQRAIESHAASYTKLCEFVDKHNLRNGSDLAVDIAIDAIAKVHEIDMRSDEEKLIDDLAAVIDSGFEGVDTAKALLANYNITKKD